MRLDSGNQGPSVLDTLFPDVGAETFLARYWPSTLAVAHGDAARLWGLASHPLLKNPAVLAEALGDSAVTVYQQAGSAPSQASLPLSAAIEAYRQGHTLSLEHIWREVPEVYVLASALRSALGYGLRTRDVALIASSAGESVPLHFDGIELIIIQLSGSKTWRLAPNRAVENPASAYFANTQGVSRRDVRSAALPAYFPDAVRLPEAQDFVSHELRAGSVLFVPKGTWHATRTDDHSISLTIKVPAQTAMSEMLDRLHAYMQARSPWRASVASVDIGPGNAHPSREPLQAMTEALANDLLAGVSWNREKRYLPHGGTRLSLRRNNTGAITVADGDARSGIPQLEVPGEWLDGMQWIARQTSPFTERTAMAENGGLSVSGMRSLIGMLLDFNAIVELGS